MSGWVTVIYLYIIHFIRAECAPTMFRFSCCFSLRFVLRFERNDYCTLQHPLCRNKTQIKWIKIIKRHTNEAKVLFAFINDGTKFLRCVRIVMSLLRMKYGDERISLSKITISSWWTSATQIEIILCCAKWWWNIHSHFIPSSSSLFNYIHIVYGSELIRILIGVQCAHKF